MSPIGYYTNTVLLENDMSSACSSVDGAFASEAKSRRFDPYQAQANVSFLSYALTETYIASCDRYIIHFFYSNFQTILFRGFPFFLFVLLVSSPTIFAFAFFFFFVRIIRVHWVLFRTRILGSTNSMSIDSFMRDVARYTNNMNFKILGIVNREVSSHH